MLLVSGFKSIQKNYNNQNSSNANFSQPQLRTKADSVSFTSSLSAVDKAAQAKVTALTQGIGAKYADVCGKGFRCFYEKALAFLDARNIENVDCILPNYNIVTNKAGSRFGSIIDPVIAELYVKRTNVPIHKSKFGDCEVTSEAANVRLLDKLFNGILVINAKKNPLEGVIYPCDLQQQAARVVKALDELRNGWYEIPHSDDDAKLDLLRQAYKILLPNG